MRGANISYSVGGSPGSPIYVHICARRRPTYRKLLLLNHHVICRRGHGYIS